MEFCLSHGVGNLSITRYSFSTCGCRVFEEDKNMLKKVFRELTLQCPKHWIIRVACWGLVGGNYEKPFDMIQVQDDAPPSYIWE